MVHIRIRTIKGNPYVYLYASKRVNGMPRSKFVAYMGPAGSNAVKRLPRKYRTRQLIERIRESEFDAVLDRVLEKRHDAMVRLG